MIFTQSGDPRLMAVALLLALLVMVGVPMLATVIFAIFGGRRK